MNEAQRGYYEMTSAGTTFEQRVAAIRDVLVPGSRIVDVGCNDARMSLALLESGHASHATGIDLENIAAAQHPRFDFIRADLRESGASVVPEADAILCLNVVHHLLLAGTEFARTFVADLLRRAETVIIDLGSLTETGPWPWRQIMARLWRSDEEVANDLFAAAAWRRPLTTYRAQNGRRVLWKLSAARPSGYTLDLEQRYRRTIGQEWQRKRIVAVRDENEIPPDCSDEVIFYRLKRRETNERFWGKVYRHPRAVGWRRDAERAVVDFLRKYEPAASLPIDERDDFGAIHPFDEELLRGTAIHYDDRHLLSTEHRARFMRLLSLVIDDGAFAGFPVAVIADPQAVVTSAGVRFVDFEPSHQYTELVKYLHGATAAQRHDVLSAFWDVNPTFEGDFPPDVRAEIEQALRTVFFREIVRERLRVRRNRELRGAFAGLTRGHPVETLRGLANAIGAEAKRARRQAPVVRVAITGAFAGLFRRRQRRGERM